MKALCFLLVLAATSSFAGDVFVFKKGVKFDHHNHQTEKVGVCKVCHEETPGKIVGFGKTWAHKNCVECHDLYQTGPTGCSGCHTQ